MEKHGSMGDSLPDRISEKLKNASQGPGVYKMLDKNGKILYIGKAKNLQSRLRSYFGRSLEEPKTIALVAKILDFESILTQSEAEALILESILIKRFKPRYNVLLKDDRSFPYVVIDENHSFPKLTYVRRPKKRPKQKIYGPFAAAGPLRSALRTLSRVFRLRDCSDQEFANRSRPCINHQIGICSAPCTGMISHEEYVQDIDRALKVLGGQLGATKEQLEASMLELAEREEFEQAARIRDQIQLLEETVNKRKSQGATIERGPRGLTNRDILGWYRKPDACTITLLFLREGELVDSSNFHLEGIEGRSDQEVLFQFLCQLYLTDDPLNEEVAQESGTEFLPGAEIKTVPDELILPFPLEEAALLQESLLQLGHKVAMTLAHKGVKQEQLEMAARNAEFAFGEKQREKGSIYRVLSELKARLRLENYPRRMECFDVSNLGDTGIVASRVVFIEGQPDKSLYRHYKIRSTSTQNDFASMREVIERRLLRSQDQNLEDPPDLIVIDGGKGQLAMAEEVMKELNVTGIDLVSLAKAKTLSAEELASVSQGQEIVKAFERVFKPGRANPIVLAPDSSVCHLLQRLRDEAHRFAVEFQRKQRPFG
jgi:excinuclease ABC subunit C